MFKPDVPPMGVIADLSPETPVLTDTPPVPEGLGSLVAPDDLSSLLGSPQLDTLDITAPPERGQDMQTGAAEPAGAIALDQTITVEAHYDEQSGRATGWIPREYVEAYAEEADTLPPRGDAPPPIDPPDEPPLPTGGSDESGEPNDGNDDAASMRAVTAEQALYGPLEDTGAIPVKPHIFESMVGGGEDVEERPDDTVASGVEEAPDITTPESVETPGPEEIARVEQSEAVRHWVSSITQRTEMLVDAAGAGTSPEQMAGMRDAVNVAKDRLLAAIQGELGEQYQEFAPELLSRVLDRLREL